ncbi:helix-turn-helix domain-containing protein [Gemmatimonadota bacterium]
MNTESPEQHRGLCTVEKAAHFLGIAPSTIRGWVYSGKLAFVKLGATRCSPLRFRHEDLEAFIENHWFGADQ